MMDVLRSPIVIFGLQRPAGCDGTTHTWLGFTLCGAFASAASAAAYQRSPIGFNHLIWLCGCGRIARLCRRSSVASQTRVSHLLSTLPICSCTPIAYAPHPRAARIDRDMSREFCAVLHCELRFRRAFEIPYAPGPSPSLKGPRRCTFTIRP